MHQITFETRDHDSPITCHFTHHMVQGYPHWKEEKILYMVRYQSFSPPPNSAVLPGVVEFSELSCSIQRQENKSTAIYWLLRAKNASAKILCDVSWRCFLHITNCDVICLKWNSFWTWKCESMNKAHESPSHAKHMLNDSYCKYCLWAS